MAGDTSIEWTNRTWNPVTGCSKVSEGCRNCYAEAISLRFKRSVGPWNAVNAAQNVVLHADRLDMPLRWKQPSKVFVNSMSDLFHENVPDEFIDRVFGVMAYAEWHTFQVLTKRPERMAEYVNGLRGSLERLLAASRTLGYVQEFERQRLFDWPLPNVWLGTSTEDQRTADERIPHLMATPAAVRFLSCEPLLGPVALEQVFDGRYMYWLTGEYLDGDRRKKIADGLNWVIVGGESGPKARPMHPLWVRSLRDQCVEAGVPFFFKQHGEWVSLLEKEAFAEVPPNSVGPNRVRWIDQSGSGKPVGQGLMSEGDVLMTRLGKHLAGRLLDGREWNEFPVVGGAS